MKLFLLTILIFLSGLSISRAQLAGGLKGGVNFSELIFTNKTGDFENITTGMRTSYHAGSYVRHSFSDHFAWQIEMLFSNKGSRIQKDETKSDVSLNYLNWPILIVYNAGRNFGVEAGLELGYLVSGTSAYRQFDMGMDIGLRYDINDRLLAGFRYNLGFPFEMKTDDLFSYQSPSKYQQNVMQVYIGYNLIHEGFHEK